MAKKRGKFSITERNFIERNVFDLKPDQIAERLNRNESAIIKYIKENNLAYESEINTKAEKILIQRLESRKYWPEVQSQLFNEREVEYFKSIWVSMMIQFQENMTFSEELDLKQYIMLDIMSNRVMRERSGYQKKIEELEKSIREEKEKEDQNPVFIESSERILEAMRSSLPNFTNELTKILDKVDKLRKELKASRDSRIKRIEDGKSTWKDTLLLLENDALRAKIGREMELRRLAKEKAKSKLAQNHEYIDGTVDRPLNTPETVQPEDFN